MKKKHIITGPPGSGKTSLIEVLSIDGFPCINEVSRQIIKSEQLLQSDGTPWQNIKRFSQLVFDQTMETLTSQNDALFIDRSLIDNIAYLQHAQKPVPNYLNNHSFYDYYHRTVFYCPLWPEIYITDPQRPQKFEDQVSLSNQLVKTYESLGFQLIDLPLTSVSERKDFILKHIDSH